MQHYVVNGLMYVNGIVWYNGVDNGYICVDTYNDLSYDGYRK